MSMLKRLIFGSLAVSMTFSAVTTPALAAPAYRAVAQGTVHIVQPGDSIYRISVRYGVSMAAIQAANGLTNPNLIFVGQRLVIPTGGIAPRPQPTAAPGNPAPTQPASTPGGMHVVQRGEFLALIARRYNVTVQAIITANGITNPNRIFVGQRLVIPGQGAPVPQPTAVPTQPPAGSPPTATPRPGTPPPPTGGFGGFQLGGHVESFQFADKMRYAGMTWVKKQIRWSPGASTADAAGRIAEARAQGFRIMLGVVGAPGDISGGANFDSYAQFVGELARLGADAIEVWNEPNIDREWPTGQISPVTYTELLRRSYIQIKANNPNTIVISGAPAPTGAEGAFGLDRVWNDDRYMRGMAAAGAANYMDCIGLHYNEGIVPPTQNSGDPRSEFYTRYYNGMVSTYYNAFGGARPLCFTEIGYLTPEGYGPLPPGFAWAGNVTLAQQAQWLADAANLAKNSGIVRIFIVWNVDFRRYDSDPMGGYAIVRPDGNCPACDRLRTVTGGR